MNGDPLHGRAAFREAADGVRRAGYEAVEGPIPIDENRNAIGNNYIIQVTAQDDGTLANRR